MGLTGGVGTRNIKIAGKLWPFNEKPKLALFKIVDF